MQDSQLLEHIAPEHRTEVRELFATFLRTTGARAADCLDSFAHMLFERGLLPAEGLKDFMTYHAPAVGTLAPDEELVRRYELMTLVGQGAMGEVYLGRDPSLKRTVAVKRTHPDMADDPVLLQRFLTEAQVTAQLDHPAIVPVYGLERDERGALTYAMKFVRGVTLTHYLADALDQSKSEAGLDMAHSLRARIETFIPVLNAVAYAHRRGVVHRDLKPDNIMVGSFGQVLVMDWGIARLLGHAEPDATSPPIEVRTPADALARTKQVPLKAPVADTLAAAPEPASEPASGQESQPAGNAKLTLAGMLIGTPAYMSPEQARGLEVGPSSDQFTLGVILQEIATLQPATDFDAASMSFVRIRDVSDKVPRELRAIIDKATAFELDRRYPSVVALADDLKRFLRDESIEADPDRGLRRLTRWIGKHRGLAAALGAMAVVIGAALVMWFVWQGERALVAQREAAERHEHDLARIEALVDTQGKRMSERLHDYESLLEGIASSASLVLTAPAPASDVVVYEYNAGRRDPEPMPAYVRESPAYGQRASLRADYSAAWGIDRATTRARADQLARMEPLLRTALLRSSRDPALLSAPFEAAERRVLEEGVPLVWTYLNTQDGLGLGMPGTWGSYDSPGGVGYDHRREDWYQAALTTRGPVWTVATDESQFGLTLSCLQTVRTTSDEVLGVAGVDIWLDRFIAELLDIPELAAVGAEAILLDAQGNVLTRSRDKTSAKPGSDYVPKPYEDAELRNAVVSIGPSGHLALAPLAVDGDKRLAIWTRLGSAGLSYLIVGPEAAMLAVTASAP